MAGHVDFKGGKESLIGKYWVQKGERAAGRERGQDRSQAHRDQDGWSGAGTPSRDSHGHCHSLLSAVAEIALGQRQLSPPAGCPRAPLSAAAHQRLTSPSLGAVTQTRWYARAGLAAAEAHLHFAFRASESRQI